MIVAIWLACMHEDKLYDQFRIFKPYSINQDASSSNSIGFSQTSKPHVTNTTWIQSNSRKSITSLQIKKLTSEKMQIHREKGLYFNWDEKFTKNYTCKSKFLVLLSDSYSILTMDDADIIDAIKNNICEDESYAVSYHALNGTHVLRTLRFFGQINSKMFMFLIDSGSTHKFI